jgi:hypothetical protein
MMMMMMMMQLRALCIALCDVDRRAAVVLSVTQQQARVHAASTLLACYSHAALVRRRAGMFPEHAFMP